ncbi:MAG: hypothetical protein WA705_13065 [Candidatus Ozemobacteraceae bacterium]
MKIGGVQSSMYVSEVKQVRPALPKNSEIQATNTSSNKTDSFVFSKKAEDLLNIRSISDLEKLQFKSIISRASETESPAKTSPKEFLNTLSITEMDLVRRVHSLAESIKIESLSEEGAKNLLVQPGSAEDLDNNGLTTVGAGNFITFPPKNAPASFKKAWEDASEGLSFADIPMELPFMTGLANLHENKDGSVTSYEPTDPEWKNPFADSNYDYGKKIKEIVSGIEYQHSFGQVSEEQYKKEMSFYSRLTQGMAENQTSSEKAA